MGNGYHSVGMNTVPDQSRRPESQLKPDATPLPASCISIPPQWEQGEPPSRPYEGDGFSCLDVYYYMSCYISQVLKFRGRGEWQLVQMNCCVLQLLVEWAFWAHWPDIVLVWQKFVLCRNRCHLKQRCGLSMCGWTGRRIKHAFTSSGIMNQWNFRLCF